jgi:subtilisin-like proprotein convertase family protein
MNAEAGNKKAKAKTPDWRQALTEAREKYSELPGCLGISYGEKRRKNQFTGEQSIIVYVREKVKDRGKVPKEELVQEEIAGFMTDVVEPFSKKRVKKHLDYIKDHYRSHDLAALDFSKIRTHHMERMETPSDIGRISTVGQTVIIEDPNGRLITEENGEEIPDLFEAYKVFKEHHGDVFDFVTFFSDIDSGFPTFDTSFHLGIYNDIKGIGTSLHDYRNYLGNPQNLQSLHFIHHTHFNRYVLLQEVGHRWGAFVRFRENNQGPIKGDLLIQTGSGAYDHWNIYFDDDKSPMDYDVIDWIANADGTFSYVTVPDSERKYCNLDLYLMGLIPPNQVGSFYYLENIQNLGAQRFSATKKALQIDNIVLAEGPRDPNTSNSQKAFRQAFVLLTKNMDQSLSLATTIDRFREDYKADFKDAVQERATVDTTVATGAEPDRVGYIYQEYKRKLVIPDKIAGHLPVNVESVLYFAEPDPITSIEVSLKITHPYTGDLGISLIAPSVGEIVLKERSSEPDANIDHTYTPDDTPAMQALIGRSANGPWKLRITDTWEEDTGYLESWSLRISF